MKLSRGEYGESTSGPDRIGSSPFAALTFTARCLHELDAAERSVLADLEKLAEVREAWLAASDGNGGAFEGSACGGFYWAPPSGRKRAPFECSESAFDSQKEVLTEATRFLNRSADRGWLSLVYLDLSPDAAKVDSGVKVIGARRGVNLPERCCIPVHSSR